MPLLKKVQYTPKPTPLHTYGRSTAKGNRRGCLSPDGTTYGREYCKGYLINQGIGIIEAPRPVKHRAFSKAFSNAFS